MLKPWHWLCDLVCVVVAMLIIALYPDTCTEDDE